MGTACETPFPDPVWLCIAFFLQGNPAQAELTVELAAADATNPAGFLLEAEALDRIVNYLSADSEGKVTPPKQAAGPASQAGNGDNIAVLNLTGAKHDFKWEEPVVGPESEAAWPARPLPEVTLVPGVGAAEIDPVLWPANLNGQRPVGVKLASLPSQGTEDFFNNAGEIVYAPRPPSPGYRKPDPNAHLPRPLGDGIRQVQGVVLYRQQVANGLFPAVPGDTIQVSPLVRKIAWIPTTLGNRSASRLIDPFFAIKLNAPPDINYSLDLYLLDTQGVVNGARYHYYLV